MSPLAAAAQGSVRTICSKKC